MIKIIISSSIVISLTFLQFIYFMGHIEPTKKIVEKINKQQIAKKAICENIKNWKF